MLKTLVTRKSAATLPVLALGPKGYAEWKKKQGKAVLRWLDANEFEPSGNRVLLVPGSRGPKLALLGTSDSGLWTWAGAAQRLPAGRYVIEGAMTPAEATEAAIGWALSSYRYERYKTTPTVERKELVWPRGADRAEVSRTVGAISWIRDLINTPAEDLGPAELVTAAQGIAARHDASVDVVSGERLTERFPAIAAVGRGSARAPRLIDLVWGAAHLPRLTLVGKGVCFDSGGLDIKNAAGMLRMKKDMGGAAIVLGLADMIMDAKLPVRLRVLIPAVENLPGPSAYRPADVLRTRKGLTVEVSNTDAEGRLILADALAEADSEAPELLIDVATLTGSARLAVGTEITPFFTNDRRLADDLAKAARAAREPVWRMPLHRGYRRHLESRVADLKNAPSVQLGGAIIAALFLQEFVDRSPAFLHLDVFGWNEHPRPGRPMGGEASALRPLWLLLLERYGPAAK